jgi:hypothetical protein
MKIALLSVLLLAAPPALGQDLPIVLEGPALRAEFAQVDNAPLPGQRLELRALCNKLVPLADVLMAPLSGAWTVRLQRTPDASGPLPPWMEVSMDGSVVQSSPATPVGTLDNLQLLDVTVAPDGSSLSAQWMIDATLDGVPGSVVLTTSWQLVPDQPMLDTTADFTLPGGVLPWHVALVTHPQVRVAEFEDACGTDALLVPFGEGVVIDNPTEGEPGFDGQLIPPAASRPESQPLQLAAYWDGCTPSRCVLCQPTEVGRSWHELHVQAFPGTPGSVSIEYQHLPADVFATTGWALPAPIRVGVIAGDWWDAAASYRGFLASDAVTSTWYHGPVGSPANPIAPQVKDLVAEVFLFNQYTGDNLDLFSRQMLDIERMLGHDVLATYYGGHAPDTFGQWFLQGGYLPGRPSFAASVREGQKQFHDLVMPYVQGSAVTDCADPALGPSQCDGNEVLTLAQSAVAEDEGLEAIVLPSPTPPRGLFMSPRSAWWLDFLPQHVQSIASFTGAAAVYLDFFLTTPDFDTGYDPDTEPPPGGGDYPWTGKLQQMHAIRQALGEDFLVTNESIQGRFTEEAHLMHSDPADYLLPIGTAPGPTGAPVLVSMPNAHIVPLFRAVHDNVKLARIVGVNAYANPAQRAWVEAVSVLTFGRIPSLSWSFSEIESPITQRFPFASYIGLLGGSAAGDFPFGAGPPPGDLACAGTSEEGPSSGSSLFKLDAVAEALCDAKPKQHFPFYGELTGLTTALRDYGLRTWHNGTIERLPQYEVVVPPGFDGAATVDPVPDDGAMPFTPVYNEALPGEARFLVPGMFRAPVDDPSDLLAGSLVFVLCNPWVDPADPVTLQASFTFEPARYAGWSDTTPYVIITVQGGRPLFATYKVGNFTQPNVPVAPGEIRWWIFRKLDG